MYTLVNKQSSIGSHSSSIFSTLSHAHTHAHTHSHSRALSAHFLRNSWKENAQRSRDLLLATESLWGLFRPLRPQLGFSTKILIVEARHKAMKADIEYHTCNLTQVPLPLFLAFPLTFQRKFGCSWDISKTSLIMACENLVLWQTSTNNIRTWYHHLLLTYTCQLALLCQVLSQTNPVNPCEDMQT